MIVNDLLLVQPMSSFTGNLVYMQYGLGEEKGGVGGRNADGSIATITNNPWTLGQHSRERADYTGERVVEVAKAAEFVPAWGAPEFVEYEAEDGSWVKVERDSEGKFAVEEGARVRYVYDNIVIPQEKLPTFVGEMKAIPVAAKARRIAVIYSQIAAFQAKTDYGFDFESTISQQAQAELAYEIDAEAVYMLKDAADKAVEEGRIDALEWTDEELDTISYSMKAKNLVLA